ncbi:hypothetical protein Q5689_03355 [Microcoleus sp. ARI1-A2]
MVYRYLRRILLYQDCGQFEWAIARSNWRVRVECTQLVRRFLG